MDETCEPKLARQSVIGKYIRGEYELSDIVHPSKLQQKHKTKFEIIKEPTTKESITSSSCFRTKPDYNDVIIINKNNLICFNIEEPNEHEFNNKITKLKNDTKIIEDLITDVEENESEEEENGEIDNKLCQNKDELLQIKYLTKIQQEKDDEIQKLKNRINDIEENIQTDLTESNKKEKQYSIKIQQLQQYSYKLQKENQILREKMKNYESSLKFEKIRSSELDEKNNELENTNINLCNTVDNLQKENENMERKMKDQEKLIKDVKNDYKTFNENVMKEYEEEIQRFKNLNEKMKTENTGLIAQMSSISNTNLKLKQENDKILKKDVEISNLKTKIEEMSRQMMELDQKYQNLQEQNQNDKKLLQETETELVYCKQMNAVIFAKLRKAENSSKKSNKKMKDLSSYEILKEIKQALLLQPKCSLQN